MWILKIETITYTVYNVIFCDTYEMVESSMLALDLLLTSTI